MAERIRRVVTKEERLTDAQWAAICSAVATRAEYLGQGSFDWARQGLATLNRAFDKLEQYRKDRVI